MAPSGPISAGVLTPAPTRGKLSAWPRHADPATPPQAALGPSATHGNATSTNGPNRGSHGSTTPAPPALSIRHTPRPPLKLGIPPPNQSSGPPGRHQRGATPTHAQSRRRILSPPRNKIQLPHHIGQSTPPSRRHQQTIRHRMGHADHRPPAPPLSITPSLMCWYCHAPVRPCFCTADACDGWRHNTDDWRGHYCTAELTGTKATPTVRR
jgi:hypothetical protein